MVRRRRQQAVAVEPDPTDFTQLRLNFEYLPLDDLEPYEFNPRDNEAAIEGVKNSIEQFGFLIPVVIDNNNILVAGHTRTEAAKLLQMEEIPVVRAEHLSAEQIQAFRIIDNKLAELASWDTDLLAQEMQGLSEVFDFTEFGWNQEEVDCLSDVVQEDCLGAIPSPEDEEDEHTSTNQGRGPARTRIVIGEFVMYLPVEQYNLWSNEIKNNCDYVSADIHRELFRRLGLSDYAEPQ